MELYHALNRGVEKRPIFLDDQDRKRFVQGLELFNDARSIDNLRRMSSSPNVRLRKSNMAPRPLVDIHAWCVMKNHYHLLLSEREEGGFTKFIRKLNIGYAKYFNERYRRSGTLFQSRTKKVRIVRDAHFSHIIHYIHLNPLDYMPSSQEWRQYKIKNAANAVKYLDEYQWSSYPAYCGQKNFSNVTHTAFFKGMYKNYPQTLKQYLSDLQIDEVAPLTLE